MQINLFAEETQLSKLGDSLERLKIMVLHKKWYMNKLCVEHLFNDPLDNEPLAA